MSETGTCRCGCGDTPKRGEWSQGHDVRAVRARIRDDFGGSVAAFIAWYDANRPTTTPPGGDHD